MDEHHKPADASFYRGIARKLAEANPEWTIDLNEEVVGGWRGEQGNVAAGELVARLDDLLNLLPARLRKSKTPPE